MTSYLTSMNTISLSVTELVSNWPLSLSKYCSFISRPTSLPLFHAIHRCDHSDRLPLQQYVYQHARLLWQSRNPFHPLLLIFGINCLFIYHPFLLFLLSGRDSNITCFWMHSPVLPHHPVMAHQLGTSHLVMLPLS